MVSRGTWIVALAVALLGSRPAASAQPTPLDNPAAIDKVFERFDRTGSPGCAVGVAEGGRTIHAKGYGMADLEHGIRIWPSTVFEAGSIAKQFTAAAIILLAQDGKLSLDDAVRKYVPELPDFGAPILIRHVLSHTSGLRCQWPMLALAGRPLGTAVHTMGEMLELYGAATDLNFTPGTEHLYSSTAYVLLAVIVERVSGKTLNQFCQARLFEPLGMARTRWREDFTALVRNRATAYRPMPDGQFHAYMPLSNVVGNGGLLTTVEDLLVWNNNLDRPTVGGQAMVDQLQAKARLNDGFETDYARGLYVFDYRGLREVSHGGTTGGYDGYLMRFPDAGLSVAVLCNTIGANPAQTAHEVADILLAKRLKDREVLRTVAAAREDLEGVAGLYRELSTDAVLQIAWDEKARTLRADGQPLAPIGDGRLTTTDGARRFSIPIGWSGPAPVAYLTETGDRARPRNWERQQPFTPSAAQLAEFAGTYMSSEIGVTYSLLVEDGRLVVHLRPAQRFLLVPAFKDGFTTADITIRFTRRPGGAVDGLSIYAGRARHVRFVKQ